MSVTLEIADDLLARLQSDRCGAEAELLIELAIALYREGKLPVGVAAQLADVELGAFEALLMSRRVPMPYSLQDLEHDVAYGRDRG